MTSGEILNRADAAIRHRLVRPALCSNTLQWSLRMRAQKRGFDGDGRATVVIVNWQSLQYLAVAIYALRRFSPETLKILVVDNHSIDGSKQWLRNQPEVDTIALPVNVHHGPAMDIGFLMARTEFVISLDVDAFPISAGWLDALLTPLANGAEVSGVASHRAPYVHPCMLAMRRERFVRQEHTFRSRGSDFDSPESWDTGELITRRELPAAHLIPLSRHVGPHWLGEVWDDVAYHNMYSVRHLKNLGTDMRDDVPIDGVITYGDSRSTWEASVTRFLGLSPQEALDLAALP
jgi:glycosyltransferase involved in cell wall biosynthesis